MPSDTPNVLFVLSDEHGYRYFGHRDAAAGGEPVQTPTLDGLVNESTTFEHAYAGVPLCAPSRLCLLTGRHAQNAGAWDNDSHLRSELETLPASLSAAGYRTALIGKMHLGGDNQYAGFDDRPYGDLTGGTGHQPDPITPPHAERGMELRSRTADAGVTEIPESLHQEQNLVREAVSYIREREHRDPDQPWFVCASFSRPHFPLTAPARFLDRYWPDGVTEPAIERSGDTADHPFTEAITAGFRTDEIDPEEEQLARAAYFACVDYFDEILGDFLGMLERDGLLENTIVVYTSDHGEMAGEHGIWWKHTWHESAVRVPLAIQLPAHRDGDRPAMELTTPVSLVDLYSTLCGLVDAPTPDALDGADLSEAIESGREPDRPPVFIDNLIPRWGDGTEFRIVRDGSYKYVRFRGLSDLCFDIDVDPAEHDDLVRDTGEHAAAVERLEAIAENSLDFDAAEERRVVDERDRLEHELRLDGTPASPFPNLYHLPDGRIVDAETPLYDPTVVIEDPSETFGNDPGR